METVKLVGGWIVDMAALLMTPALIFLACRGWKRSVPDGLPRWRRIVGLISIAVILVNWIGVLFLVIAMRVNPRTSYTENWEATNILAAAAGTIAALTLKGRSRIQAVVAGCFMIAIWVASFIVT